MKNNREKTKNPKGAPTPKGSNAKALEAIASLLDYTKVAVTGKRKPNAPAAPDLTRANNTRICPVLTRGARRLALRDQVAFRDATGRIWAYRGKRGRVLAMLATIGGGVTQRDTYPWHTRLAASIRAMRKDGLEIDTKLEGEYRHARYFLKAPGTLIIQADNRLAGGDGSAAI